MPGRGSQRSRVRRQPLEKLEDLCSDISSDPAQPLTLNALLIVENSVPENGHPSLWDSVSERALPGLLSIYAASIRCSSPLLDSGSARHLVEHYASVRAALSRQLATAGTLDAGRSCRLALSILRSQTLRCYAVLLGGTADSLLRHPSKRNEDVASSLLIEVDGIAQFVSRGAKSGPGSDSASPSDVPLALESELTASSLLEHWARLLLALAGCEGSKRALDIAATFVPSLSRALSAFVAHINPECACSLLVSSPCLSYFAVSQMVGLCTMQDFGAVYGMPRVPCGDLFEAVLALQPPQMAVGGWKAMLLDAFAEFTENMLSALPVLLERLLQQDAEPSASASGPTANNAGIAGVERMVAYAEAAGESPALAGAGAGTAGVTAAAEGQEQQQPGHEGAAGQRGRGELAAAAARAGGRIDTPPPPLVNPVVLLEVSLRLATALCTSVAKLQGLDIPVRSRGGGGGSGTGTDEWQPQVPYVMLDCNGAASVGIKALAVARQLLHLAPSAPAALARTGPSPLERWWEGAVAVGGALIAVVSQPDGRDAQDDVDAALNGFFEQLGLMLAASVRPGDPGPPAQPSDSVAAALSAGFLPCLERLLPAALPFASTSTWQYRLGPGWDAAWAQMLMFGNAGQMAAVICAAAEGLREALAAFRAASASAGQMGPGGGDVWQLYCAMSVAAGLTGTTALDWLSRLAGGQSSDPGVADGGPAPAPAAAAACGPVTRLGELLSLIAARLLPELSRSVLEALLPWAASGHHDLVCYLLDRQLVWVPILVGALATESAPAAAAAVTAAAVAPVPAAPAPAALATATPAASVAVSPAAIVPAAAAAAPAAPAAAAAATAAAVTAPEPPPAAAAEAETVPVAAVAFGSGGSGVGSSNVGARQNSGSALRWRQLLMVELRLPRLLGAALGLSLGRNDTDEGGRVSGFLSGMRLRLRTALWALALLAPAELARMVAAADRAEAAAPGRAASGRGPAGGPAPHSQPPPPSSGLLRRALGPGGPLEDAALLAEVEAACAGGAAGKGAGMLLGDLAEDGLPSSLGDWLSGGRLLSLQD